MPALAGKYMIERLARIPVEVDYASECRYRDPITRCKEITLLISQSGETADTIAAQREAKAKGIKDAGHLQRGGRDDYPRSVRHHLDACRPGDRRGFNQGFYLADDRAVSAGAVSGPIARRHSPTKKRSATSMSCSNCRQKLESMLARDEECEALAKAVLPRAGFLFLGRGIHYPIALEGALKLKEISYIHAEGYPAGEMKHGPNALIDENLPVVMVATKDTNDPNSVLRYEKTMSNVKEVKARSGIVIAIATEGDEEIKESVDHVLYVPHAPELLLPILEVVPLQLLAYHIAVRRGCDVDQPRNLAKSVTVE